MYLGGIIFIDRKSSTAKQVLNNAMKELKTKNIKFCIFAEGTRRNTGEIHEFKKGAFYIAIQEKIPIIPVVFSSYKSFLCNERKIFNSGEVTVKALPEISTKNLKLSDINELIFKVRNEMIKVYNKM